MAAVETALARAGRIDALINNAGYSEIGPLEDATAEQVRTQFETNAFGPLRLAQLVLPAMRRQGSGRIINVSTISGRVSMPFIGLYCGSKFALEAMSDALRVETRPFGIDVVVIEPGSTKTSFNATSVHRALTAKRPRARYPATPQARVMLALLPRFSDRVRDSIWRQMMRLPRRRAPA